MRNTIIAAGWAAGLLAFAPAALAQSTIECRSIDYQYNECDAGALSRPQLIHQISSSACILNRTWGYNPRSDNIWVAQGCAGVFADVGGYHHGRGDTYDQGARHYDSSGRDAGALVGGLVLGAIVAGALSDGDHHSSHRGASSYDGCHGDGCRVDDPDGVPEPTPDGVQPEFR